MCCTNKSLDDLQEKRKSISESKKQSDSRVYHEIYISIQGDPKYFPAICLHCLLGLPKTDELQYPAPAENVDTRYQNKLVVGRV